jgi:hypothetical protein
MFVHHDLVLSLWREHEANMARATKFRREVGPGTPEDSASVLRQTAVVLVVMVLALIGGSMLA